MSYNRVIDANANRAAEGLRVLEDVARLVMDDAGLSARVKELRHAVRAAIPSDVVASRNTAGDVGTAITADDEHQRSNVMVLIRANAARVAEALRALEEFGKLPPGLRSAAIEALRYQLYDLERDLIACVPMARWWQVRLYVLVDAALCADPLVVARAAVAGGAQAVQLRAKGLSERAYADLAATMQDGIAGRALFVVNDHVAVAAALRADAVHVGQCDLTPALVRRVVGPMTAIGLSTHTVEQVVAAQAADVDYIGMGPMFATTTKPHEPERGPQLLDAAREHVQMPSFAIGGLDLERVRSLKARLPHGVAVAGAVCRADDPERACAELRALIDA